MATQVGPWLVSTVGEYVHPMHSGGREVDENAWLVAHPMGEEIGCGRFFETMVFLAGEACAVSGCDCGLPENSGSSLDFDGYQTRGEATQGHLAMCDKWAAISVAQHEKAVSYAG